MADPTKPPALEPGTILSSQATYAHLAGRDGLPRLFRDRDFLHPSWRIGRPLTEVLHKGIRCWFVPTVHEKGLRAVQVRLMTDAEAAAFPPPTDDSPNT